jgi:hypothetical protein
MVWSLVYLAVRKVLSLILLVGRSDWSKELEILVLRHELALLRRRSGREGCQNYVHSGRGSVVLMQGRRGDRGRRRRRGAVV